jgi:uncharacterized protein YbaP (TraB family)
MGYKENQKQKAMKKINLLFLTFIFSAMTVFGQGKDNSLLWKISGNNLTKSSYLYGTFHLLCPADLNIKDKVKDAVDQSEQMVLELDFDDPSVMKTIQQNMAYTDGTTAKDYLDESEYKLVTKFFRDSLNMPFERLNAIKPFFLSSITMLHFAGCQPVSFEQKLTSMASKRGMEVRGLETVREQLNFIENLPMKVQKKMLMENLKNYDSSKVMFDKMMGFYLNENLEELNAISEKYLSEDYADFKKDLLTDRNKAWIPEIRELIKKKASFVAVGAAHLPGDQGVIELLRRQGYTVEPVHQAPAMSGL